MSILSQEQENKNRQKYGDKQYDVISEMYRLGKREGDTYAIGNAIKYLRRYLSKSEKGQNKMDLAKAFDYIQRAVEKADVSKNSDITDVEKTDGNEKQKNKKGASA